MKNQGKKLVFYNSAFGLIYQVSLLVFQFIERKVFLSTLGAEILGINSSMTAIIAMASLAEGGMGTAIVYHLYKPLEEEDYEEASKLLAIYRRVYNLICILVIVASVALLPFLHLLLSGVKMTGAIYIYFELIAVNTAASYLLSYKRCIFIADRKDYYCKIIDSTFNVVFTIFRILLLLTTKSFTLYLLASIVQTVGANLIIQYLCKQRYSGLTSSKFELDKFKGLLPDFKDLFAGQIAAYLFNSSDNIIISTFVSTLSVGLLAGYTMVTKSIRTLILAIFNGFGSILGRMIVSTNEGDKKRFDSFQMYCYSIFFVAVVIIVPEFILLQDFVVNVWGNDYVMNNGIVWLLVIEQYLTLVQDPCGVYIVANGEFKKCRNADALAAISNIISSLILVQFLGIQGVLIGTIISRILQWILKAYYANVSSLKSGFKGLLKYWGNNFYKIVITFVALAISSKLVSLTNINSFLIRFVVCGCISVVSTGIILFASTFFLNESKLAIKFLLKRG